jgi:hypothetical protein
MRTRTRPIRTIPLLLAEAPAPSSHILQCVFTDGQRRRQAISTAVDVADDRSLEIELPHVAHLIDDVVGNGWTAGFVLRTFDLGSVAFLAPNGFPIPFKTVRGWSMTHGRLHPLPEASMFDAFCTDSTTGEPIPPERGVQFADAWEVVL